MRHKNKVSHSMGLDFRPVHQCSDRPDPMQACERWDSQSKFT